MSMFDFLFGKSPAASPPTPAQPSPRKSLDWRACEPHLLLLSRFLYAQNSKDAAQQYWEGVLGEPPQAAVDRFTAEGMLVSASLTAKLDRTFKVTDLKPFLRERGLPVSGKKDVLLERLTAADPEGMAAKVAHLDIVECSSDARVIAEKYVAERKTTKDAAVAESLALVQANEFARASLAVSRYEAKQVFPRGMGIDWSRNDSSRDVQVMEAMFSSRPKILDGLAEEEWEPLRVAAAMMHLWGVSMAREWLPNMFVGVPRFDADTAVRMLLFHANHKLDLVRFREMGVKKATIEGCGEASCETCQAIAGKTMPLAKIPELPHAACTHQVGCRCYVSAEFDV